MESRVTAFSLSILSKELLLPELKNCNKRNNDITIYPEDSNYWPELNRNSNDSSLVQIGNNDLRLTIKGLAKIRAFNGKEIAWDALNDDFSKKTLRAYLLGSGIGALLIQRGIYLFHGNALEKNGQAIICLGESGIGKSTLAYSLMINGWNLIADDLVALNNDLNVLPGIPRIKLWKDALDCFNIDKEILYPVQNNIEKYQLMSNLINSSNSITKLSKIYILYRNKNSKKYNPGRVKLLQGEKLCTLILKDQIYRPRYVRGLGKEGRNFIFISRLQKYKPISILELPSTIEDMKKFINNTDLLDPV